MKNSIGTAIKKDAITSRRIFNVLLIILPIYGFIIGDFWASLIIAILSNMVIDHYYVKKQAFGELVENTALLNQKLETIIKNQCVLDDALAEIAEPREE